MVAQLQPKFVTLIYDTLGGREICRRRWLLTKHSALIAIFTTSNLIWTVISNIRKKGGIVLSNVLNICESLSSSRIRM